MAAGVFITFKIDQQFATVNMVNNQYRNQAQLNAEPHLAGVIADDHHGDAEYHGQYQAGGHDAVKQFALHDLEAIQTGLVDGHSVINKQTWQVKQAGEPGHHENDVQGLKPEHETMTSFSVN